jgi:predicted nucleic acid-binding protein
MLYCAPSGDVTAVMEAAARHRVNGLRRDQGKSRLERVGQPFDANSLLVAVHALTLGHTLATDDVCAFGRIEELRVEKLAEGLKFGIALRQRS